MATLSMAPEPRTPSSDDLEDKKADIGSYVVPQDEQLASEYSEYLSLKTKFENDPKAYRKFKWKRELPSPPFISDEPKVGFTVGSGSPRGHLPLVLLLHVGSSLFISHQSSLIFLQERARSFKCRQCSHLYLPARHKYDCAAVHHWSYDLLVLVGRVSGIAGHPLIASISYGALEVPAQMLLQRVGPRYFLSTIVCGFGITAFLHVIIKNRKY